MVAQQEPAAVEWALLSYRIPREPSTPRIAVWRKLRDLGVGQIGDGLVALPHDARTKEQLEWVAARVLEADGDAAVWIARTARSTSEALAAQMRAAREREYTELLAEVASLDAPVDKRTLGRLRRSLRGIGRRDHFRAPSRDRARLAIEDLVVAADVPARGSAGP